MAELLCIPYSPWSEKARWALDVRGIVYTKRSYQPLLGEPALRLLLKRWRGPVSAMAQVLAFSAPPRSGLKLGESSRRAFTDPVLSARYGDLVAWRDALYAHYRGV